MNPHPFIRRRRRDDRGFTLIELLVVIVILGILSAVVVFAVRGAGDKGDAAARATDERIIRTAMETFCARYGRYPQGDTPEARMDELAKGPRVGTTNEREGPGFLSGSSTYNTVPPTPATGCGGLGTPAGEECKSPTPGEAPKPWVPGMWCRTNPPGRLISDEEPGLVQLNDGRIFTGFELFDPKIGTWQPANQLDPSLNRATGMVVLKDNPTTPGNVECGNRCGQVLARLDSIPNYSSELTWALFNPAGTPPSGVGVGSWERLSSPLGALQREGRAAQIMGNVDDCGTYCGKVLVASTNVYLYDPKSDGQFELVPAGPGLLGPLSMMSPLPRGQVFLMFTTTASITACTQPPGPRPPPPVASCYETRVFDPLSGTFFPGPMPPIGLDLPQGRGDAPAIFPDGKVVFHYTDNYEKYATAIYRPGKGPIALPGGTGSWTEKDACPAKVCVPVSSLPGDKFLATDSVGRRSWELDIEQNVWRPSGNLQGNPQGSPAVGILISAAPGVADTCGTNCNKVLAGGSTSRWAQLYKPL